MKPFQCILSFIIFTFPTLSLFSQCAGSANIYTFTFNGKSYEVVKEKKNWQDAAACAVERGGYLVEINDAAEQAAIMDAITNGAGVSSTYTTVPSGGGIAYVWTGATDQQTEGTWLWDGNNDNSGLNFWTGQGANGNGSGSAVSGAYYHWGGSSTGTCQEPDNYGGTQHYAAIGLAGWPSGTTMLGIVGEWNDIGGTNQLYFVIEKENGTGIQEDQEDSGSMGFFPNPANSTLFPDPDTRVIEIFDLNGCLVMRTGWQEKIDLCGLTQALYVIRSHTVTGIRTTKLILCE